jgi:hypothetical protein
MSIGSELSIFGAGVTLPALVATPVGCPAMKGLVRAQPTWGRTSFGCGPTILLEMPVPTPSNEPELSLREAAIVLVALIVFVAIMAWTATLLM